MRRHDRRPSRRFPLVNRFDVLRDVKYLVLDELLKTYSGGKYAELEYLINDTIYHERERLNREKKSRRREEDVRFWVQINRDLLRTKRDGQVTLLDEIIKHYLDEIIGNFDPRVYYFATNVLPIALSLLLNRMSWKNLFTRLRNPPNLRENIIIQGEVAHVLDLAKKGTLIFAPTHLSNLDSLVIGYSIHEMGLPPAMYGAGLNLFTNFILSFFMNNLGAYKVDRKKNNNLYKLILKTYSAYMIENGYNSLFFPGGTRSRSGAIETHLKLGLMGTGLKAYISNLRKKKENPDVYVVPCTLSYHLVLEARTLIEDCLKERGKSRFIIEDDEFSKPWNLARFISKIFELHSEIYFTLGTPLDVFGNRIDGEGNSVDSHGRKIDRRKYVLYRGETVHYPQRDMQYTFELGQAICDSFRSNNVVLATHLVSFTLFRILREKYPEMDLYRLLRRWEIAPTIPIRQVTAESEERIKELRYLRGTRSVRLSPLLREGSIEEIVTKGLLLLSTYHHPRAVKCVNGRVVCNSLRIIYYYSNRIAGYFRSTFPERIPSSLVPTA
jgi:glycerol-3-phosphate O-acyltransferase